MSMPSNNYEAMACLGVSEESISHCGPALKFKGERDMEAWTRTRDTACERAARTSLKPFGLLTVANLGM